MNEYDLLDKLFRMLKESVDKNEDAIKSLINQQIELVAHIKNLPVDEVRTMLKDHDKAAADNIDTCSDAITTSSDSIMKILHTILNRVNRMILVVVVAFTIVTGGYFIIRTMADNDTIIEKHIDKRFDQLSHDIAKQRQQELQEIRREIQNHGHPPGGP